MGLGAKQEEFTKQFRSKEFAYLCAAGTTGSGKSLLTLGLPHYLCMKYSGLKFAVIRKSEKNLKQTSIPSYKKMKMITKSEHISTVTDMTARYANGSEIIFVWADITKDPELNNIRGLELTGALIEEANQVDKKYFDLLKTRIGRWNNELCFPFILLNLNPSQGWVKELFYDNCVNHTMPDRHFFMEFDESDINLGSKKVTELFRKSLSDLPEEEYGRFVLNNWDYGEIPNQLVKYEWYKNCCLDQYFIKKTDRGLLSLDPAGEGKDSTVFARMHGNHIGWWEEYPKQDPGESGLIMIERAKELSIRKKDCIVDGIGIGSGALSIMKDRKFVPTIFEGGRSPVLDSAFLRTLNLRAEGHWLFREGLRKEEITIQHHPKLQKECTKCTYDVSDRVIKILPKEVLKKVQHIGWSPGHLDNAIMLAHRYYTTGGNLQHELIKRQVDSILKRNVTSRADRERRQSVQNSLIGV